jgi:hypothetical protein
MSGSHFEEVVFQLFFKRLAPSVVHIQMRQDFYFNRTKTIMVNGCADKGSSYLVVLVID